MEHEHAIYLDIDQARICDPLLFWTLVTERCPECGARARHRPDGLAEMLHVIGCSLAERVMRAER